MAASSTHAVVDGLVWRYDILWNVGHMQCKPCWMYPVLFYGCNTRCLLFFCNSHRIRHSAGAGCPGGVIDQLYFLPPDGAHDCGIVVSPATATSFSVHVAQPKVCVSDNFREYLDYLRNFYGLGMPAVWQDAVSLFMKLSPHMWLTYTVYNLDRLYCT